LAVPAWTDPLWLAEAHEWIHGQVDGLGVAIVGAIEQPHIRPWSTVMRVPTSSGDLWFKANIGALAHEAAVVDLLVRLRPEAVPELFAVDLERGWMLMGDGGVRLREVIEGERDLGRWRELLPRYAELQMDAAGHADQFVTLGAPDRRLAMLTVQYEQLLDEVEGVTAAELRRLREIAPRIGDLCTELAGSGIPETIQHDDFHDGQIFVRNGTYLFFDWGDACVSHPFFTMSVTLEGVIAWGLDDVEGSEDITPFRDAYLRPFRDYAERAELEAAHTIALQLGWICRALNVHRFASALDPPHREEHLRGVGLRLQLATAGLR
jgi:Phosphotransferase enzyme family